MPLDRAVSQPRVDPVEQAVKEARRRQRDQPRYAAARAIGAIGAEQFLTAARTDMRVHCHLPAPNAPR